MAKKPVAKGKKDDAGKKASPLKGIISLVSLAGVILSAAIVFLAVHDTHIGNLHYTLQPFALPAFSVGILSFVGMAFTSRPQPAPEPAQEADQGAKMAELEQKIATFTARIDKLESGAIEMLGSEYSALKQANEQLNNMLEEQKKQEEIRIVEELQALRAENAKLKEMLNGPENAEPLQVA